MWVKVKEMFIFKACVEETGVENSKLSGIALHTGLLILYMGLHFACLTLQDLRGGQLIMKEKLASQVLPLVD